MSNNIIRGTMLLTGASFLSKLLGMIYVIPFNALVGAQGGALYFYAYNPYSILISISTVGVPLAVSKFVSKYNSLGDYETGMRMFRTGLVMMFISGSLAFLALFFGAEFLATLIINDDNLGNSVADVKMVIRMVSFALLIVPAMSIVRGFFQGHQSMGPTAVSQVIEQVVRIAFLLIGAFLVVNIFNGTIATAVGIATFAAFIGALASCLVLWMYWRKRKKYIDEKVENQRHTHEISNKKLMIELFSSAGPFVIVGIAIPLYQLVDQFTFNRAMVAIGSGDISELGLAAINLYGHKLVIIPVTIATGLSIATLPSLTKSFTQKNFTLLNKQINQALQIVLVLVVPAVVGLTALSNEAYGAIYGLDNISYTGSLLAWYAPVALLFALFTVSAAILQGINEQRFAVVSLGAGFLVKLLCNMTLIHIFGAKGSIFATALAVGVAVLLNLWRIRQSIQFSFKNTIKKLLLIIILSLVMYLVIALVKVLFGMMVPYVESRGYTVIVLFLGVTIGGSVYLWLGYQTTLLEKVLGDQAKFLDRLFRRF